MSSKRKKPTKKFELWRDRTFSILIPFFFGYILLSQTNNNIIKIVLLILLLGFATGEAALVGRYVLSLLGRLTGVENEEREEEKRNNNKNDEQRNQKET